MSYIDFLVPKDSTTSYTTNTYPQVKTAPQSLIDEFEQKYPNLSLEFLKIQEQQYQLFAEKMLSYGIDNIAMGTSLETEEDIKLSLTSIWIRVNDKMNRLKNLVLKGNKNPLQNESTLDSWKDMTNYAIIAQLVSLGKWKK
jgi:hypothetical protein